jgi:isochorismate synthase
MLGSAFDLLAAYPGHGGFLFQRGRSGVAATAGAPLDAPPGTDLRRVAARAIARLRDEDAVGTSVGLVPFSQRRPVRLWVPDLVVRRDPVGSPVLRAAATAEPPRFAPPAVGPTQALAEPRVRLVPEPGAYRRWVETAVRRIRAGELEKVVLARTVEVEAGRRLDPRSLVARLRAVDPESYAFAAPTGPASTLVGASPELLVRRRGLTVESRPMAGSAPRSGDPEQDRALGLELLRSAKDRDEHRVVVDAIAEVLGTMCEELTWDPEPILHGTANVWHLATAFAGVLREPPPTVLEIVAELHPTPAVAGTPRDVALDLIGELEPFDRGAYAGAVGWIDAAGDGEWAIALRCAELVGDRATLYAGAGIVADSDPGAEVEETDRKFRAFLDALRWG